MLRTLVSGNSAGGRPRCTGSSGVEVPSAHCGSGQTEVAVGEARKSVDSVEQVCLVLGRGKGARRAAQDGQGAATGAGEE